ncbi:C45 family autoproteolytic acyltransferase/hydolase [Amedibacterium intestinale]|jgi:peptidase C45 acyl-coenzyme A:6-aminopenicillanic acid acyl-transferase|uniref:C45 family autoproteolytic acyltransferase/hydolase n=1 Tax=Amedibacterium intestinale TaxID=2583452 RepID=UPI000E4B1641|nr:C45 family peptidase [Amedibacterium intestinale]RHO27955.1 linear amide C-N hydrolase [Erysipelotrichaceae bacterium AM17-60]
MYHVRFKKSHYEAGYHWGQALKKHGIEITKQPTFVINEERKEFAKGSIPVYKKYYPEILEEIKGIADGQECSYENLCTFLLSMYCFEFNNHCTCFACKDHQNLIFGRNSDFLVELENLYMNCVYTLDNVYSFNGNTTAFVQIEDGINEYGLAAGLTFIYPKVRKYGCNAGILIRYILEKCKTTRQAISFLKEIPIASQQTITLLDGNGDMAVVECNPYVVEVIYPNENDYVAAANSFHSTKMSLYNENRIDDWNSTKRYSVVNHVLKQYQGAYSLELTKDILSGKYGFMCQYDRKEGADTVWSVIYDVKNKQIFRVEGNPSRKKFKEDTRFNIR